MEVIVLKNFNMLKPAFHHRIRARLTVFVEQMFLKRAGIHADPHRTAIIAGRFDHLAHALLAANIARVDPQAGRASLRGLYAALIVKMDVCHDRDRAFTHNLFERLGGGLVGHRDPDNIRAGIRTGLNL